jgi:hypothetical protein
MESEHKMRIKHAHDEQSRQSGLHSFSRTLSPKTHAVLDYCSVASFLVGAGLFWSRSKRAALGSLVCGGAKLAVGLMTDYPGGVQKLISYRVHGEIDVGLAAMTASMPEFMAFESDAERGFFVGQGVFMTVVGSLTKFPKKTSQRKKELPVKAA